MSNPIMSYLGNSGKNISYNIYCFHLTRVMKPIQKHITHHKLIQNLKQTREHQSEPVHPLAQFQREFRTQKNSLNIWQCSDKTYNKLYKLLSSVWIYNGWSWHKVDGRISNWSLTVFNDRFHFKPVFLIELFVKSTSGRSDRPKLESGP